MKRSQIAKTSKKSKKPSVKDEHAIITFVDEESRRRFCDLLIKNSHKPEIQKTIAEKQAKYKSFKIRTEIPELSELGINPKFVMLFKRVKNSDEWDLDLEFEKKENISLDEYFDLSGKV